MTVVEIKRSGIKDVVDNYTPNALDETRILQTPGEHPIAQLLKKYEAFLDIDFYSNGSKMYQFVQGRHSIDYILAPTGINAFLQATIQYETYPRYADNTGLFISRLIQNSYNAGNNDFYLKPPVVKNIDYLGAHLQGTKRRNINLQIDGDVGNSYGLSAKNSTFKTTKQENLKSLRTFVPAGNQIIFIHPNGTEEVMR